MQGRSGTHDMHDGTNGRDTENRMSCCDSLSQRVIAARNQSWGEDLGRCPPEPGCVTGCGLPHWNGNIRSNVADQLLLVLPKQPLNSFFLSIREDCLYFRRAEGWLTANLRTGLDEKSSPAVNRCKPTGFFARVLAEKVWHIVFGEEKYHQVLSKASSKINASIGDLRLTA